MDRFSRISFVVDYRADDPSKVTELIGVQPTAVVSSKLCSLPGHTHWVYEFHKPNFTLEQQLASMLGFLSIRAERVRDVVARYPTWIQIDVDDRDWAWPYDPNGWRSGDFELPPDIVQVASQLGLGFKLHFVSGIAGESQTQSASISE